MSMTCLCDIEILFCLTSFFLYFMDFNMHKSYKVLIPLMLSNLCCLLEILYHLLYQHLGIGIERNIRLAKDSCWKRSHFREIIHWHQYIFCPVF